MPIVPSMVAYLIGVVWGLVAWRVARFIVKAEGFWADPRRVARREAARAAARQRRLPTWEQLERIRLRKAAAMEGKNRWECS